MAALADSPEVKSAHKYYEYIDAVLNYYDGNIMETDYTVASFLDSSLKTDEDKLEFAKWIDVNFPAEPHVAYATSFAVGTTCGRPYMFSWSEWAGNKGLVLKENQRGLLFLILAQGFRTNPDNHVGVEKLYWGPPAKDLTPAEHATPLVVIQSAAQSKKPHTQS